MSSLPYLAADAVAVLVLVLALYLPRHRRRDLAVAYLGVNVGVLAVADVLASTSVAAGLGLGLFGVLSIIRLRSDELSQREVAYYFAALALGLLGGLGPASGGWVPMAFMALIVAVLAVADSPRVLPSTDRRLVRLDRAITDDVELDVTLAALLGAEILDAQVVRLDLVDDSTTVQVTSRAAGHRGVGPDGASGRATSSRASRPGTPRAALRSAR